MADAEKPRALLLVPPLYDFAAFDLFSKPLGLMRIGLWLEEGGWDTHLINALDYRDRLSLQRLGPPRRRSNGSGKFFRQPSPFPGSYPPPGEEGRLPRFARYGILQEALRSQLISFFQEGPPAMVFISGAMTYWYGGLQEAVSMVRQAARDVGLSGSAVPPLVCGGIYPSLMPEHCRKVCRPDYVMINGPHAWDDLRAWGRRRALPLPDGAPGRSYRLYDTVPAEAAVLELNRGCPLSCHYCASSRLIPRFSSGGAEAALAQLDSLYQHGTRHFAFYDDALLVAPEEGILLFLEGLRSRQLQDVFFHLPNALHMKALTPSLLAAMDQAGFQEFRMGYESSSESFHQQRDGKVSSETLDRCRHTFLEAGVPLARGTLYVLAGLPGQDPDEVEASVRRGNEAGFTVRLAWYSPVPGTALWEESCQQSVYPLAEEPLYHNNTFFPMESPRFTRSEMQRLKTLAHATRLRQ